MERYDCKVCEENVFEVEGVENLGVLPVTLTCTGCGALYTAGLINGKLRVHKGSKLRMPEPKKPKKTKAEVVEPPVVETMTASNLDEN